MEGGLGRRESGREGETWEGRRMMDRERELGERRRREGERGERVKEQNMQQRLLHNKQSWFVGMAICIVA